MRRALTRIEPYLTPLLAFSGLYFAGMIVLSLLARALDSGRANLALGHLISLVSAVVATAICVRALEGGKWDLGVFVSPVRAVRGLWTGLLAGVLIVVVTDALIMASSDYRKVGGDGLDWSLIVFLLLPAAFGEELVFRGYVLQRLYRTNRGWAIIVTSVLFAVAHGGNPAVGPVAFTNILLAGILLSLMWVWDRSLWMPTWGHVAWNVTSGPVLGHELSGLRLGPTVFAEIDPGPEWLTGGDFGIEASILMTGVEIVVIAILAWRIRLRDGALAQDALETRTASTESPDALSGESATPNEKVDSP